SELLKRSLIIWPISTVVIAIGSIGGLETASLALLVTTPFQAYISLVCVHRYIAIGWKDMALALKSSAKVAICSSVGPLVIAVLNGFEFHVTSLLPLVAILLCGVGWFAGLWLMAHPLLDELTRVALPVLARFERTAFWRRVPDAEGSR